MVPPRKSNQRAKRSEVPELGAVASVAKRRQAPAIGRKTNTAGGVVMGSETTQEPARWYIIEIHVTVGADGGEPVSIECKRQVIHTLDVPGKLSQQCVGRKRPEFYLAIPVATRPFPLIGCNGCAIDRLALKIRRSRQGYPGGGFPALRIRYQDLTSS